MLGAIIGDIAGSRFEFCNTNDYHFELFAPTSSYTDDTICTIAVADTLLQQGDFQERMLYWCRQYPDPMGAYGGMFMQWISAKEPKPYHSFGNGAAMRVSPVGYLDSRHEVIRQAIESAQITHSHTEGILGAVSVAVGVFEARHHPLDKDQLRRVVAYYYGEKWEQQLPERNCFDPTCQGCVPLAFSLLLQSHSFEDAIRQAVCYGGDSDTVGAIVGGLAEPFFGGIPQDLQTQALGYLPADLRAVVERFQAQYGQH